VVRTRATSPAYLGYHPFREATRSTVAIERVAEALLVEEETQRIMPAAGAAVTEARVHFRVNVSAITRMLPRHLRELFKREVTKRLLARRDEHVSVAPTCCAGCERHE
jgi:hypothetical protein